MRANATRGQVHHLLQHLFQLGLIDLAGAMGVDIERQRLGHADGIGKLDGAAIGKAGSFSTNTAWLSNTLLVRWDPATQTQRHWVIDARPEHWVGREPLLLQSFDVIYIPNTKIDRVGIWVDNFIRRLLPFPFFFPAPA